MGGVNHAYVRVGELPAWVERYLRSHWNRVNLYRAGSAEHAARGLATDMVLVHYWVQRSRRRAPP